jgi:hypothetical protein
MHWKRKLRMQLRHLGGWWRLRRILARCDRRMQEVEIGCQSLKRVGFLNSYDFYQDTIIFRWKFHPSNVMLPLVADETLFRLTRKLERKWRWAVRFHVRIARAWDTGWAHSQCAEYKFPLDYRF